MNNDIISAIRQNTKEIVDYVSAIDIDKINVSPSDGGWSIIRICDHFMSVDFGTYNLMASEGKLALAHRISLLPKLEATAIDRSSKAKAPPQVAPKGKTDTIEKFVSRFPSLREKTITRIENKDLNMVCDVFPHFVFGFMTFEEWLRFSMLHTKRHMLQMEELLEEII